MEVPNKKTERSRRLWHGEVLAFKDVIEKLTGNEITAEKLGQAIDLVNRRRLALQRLYNLRKVRPVPISGKDALLATQVSFYDDAQRDTQMLNALCDELDKRVAAGEGVAPKNAPRILIPAARWLSQLENCIISSKSAGAVVVCEESCTGDPFLQAIW